MQRSVERGGHVVWGLLMQMGCYTTAHVVDKFSQMVEFAGEWVSVGKRCANCVCSKSCFWRGTIIRGQIHLNRLLDLFRSFEMTCMSAVYPNTEEKGPDTFTNISIGKCIRPLLFPNAKQN